MPRAYQAKPQYPVIDADPEPATVFSNFNLGDIGFIAMGALGSGAVGYATGLPRRNAHAIFFTIVGGFAGVVAGYQSSHKRLTGFEKK